MFSGFGLQGLDGTAWYHPMRLTIDGSAVAAGNSNPAQTVLDVRATHGRDLPRSLRIYAFGAALGGQRVLDAAKALASGAAWRRTLDAEALDLGKKGRDEVYGTGLLCGNCRGR